MNRFMMGSIALGSLLILAAPTSQACGEGQFNMGQGLRYQGYLAPRAAAVLVYADGDANGERQKTYSGMQQAGHQVTIVTDAAQLDRALTENHYDVLIANLGRIDSLESKVAGANAPRVVPILDHGAEISSELRKRFGLYVLDNASLSQYLKVVDRAVTAGVP